MAADQFERAIAAIDAANADDPETIVVDGAIHPKEQAHAELVSAWVLRLDPDADEAQLLAARAHHLRRWASPRDAFPDGRVGYLRWRTDAKRRHAEEVAAILAAAGYDDVTSDRVQRIIRKEGLGTDAAVQVHEDALCLVFLETQLADLVDQLGEEHAVTVLQKTARKMSEQGLAAVSALTLAEREQALLAAATSAS